MKTKKKILLITLFCLIILKSGFAQTDAVLTSDTLRLSLMEAVQLAVKQNQQLKSVQIDEDINQFKIKELRSSALPQLSVDGTYNDNFSRASQILPGDIFGQPGTQVAVQFGTRYTYGATANLTQKLFDPTLNAGLKAAKASQGYYQLNTFKNKEDLIYNVVNIYMQLEMTEKQTELVKGNLERTKRLVDITDAQYKEGIIKKVDVDQIKVNYTNLLTQLSNSKNTYTQLLNNLKVFMNVDVSQPVKINSSEKTQSIKIADQLFLNENTDLNILKYQIELQGLNSQSIKAGYLPTLSAFANYGIQSQADQLFNNSVQSFKSGVWGLNLKVPIFDGFIKRNKIKQSDLQIDQLKLQQAYLTNNVKNDFVNASNNLKQNKDVSNAQLENMKVAEELYNVAKLSYTEGITNLSELINAENGLKEAQTQYLTALLQSNIAELDLLRTSGQLSQIIRESTPTN